MEIIDTLAEDNITKFKNDLKDKLASLDLDKNVELMEFVLNYPKLITIKKNDVEEPITRKLNPLFQRCVAKRNDGQQCTRRQKNDYQYCGTHCKSVPYGIFETNYIKLTIEVFAKDIKGIIYYIDEFMNVYDIEDIMQDIEDPRVIATAEIKDGVYTIPSFGI